MTTATTATTPGRPSVVVICGSTRFRRQIDAASRGLTLAGHIVLAPGVFIHDDPATELADTPDGGRRGEPITADQKRRLDALHLAKIDLADWVYVVNPGGYLGESTRREIAYATRLGKDVVYSHPTDPPGHSGATPATDQTRWGS